MSIELRPLSLGELLDQTFAYYREHLWTFVGIMIPAEALVVAAGLALQALGVHAVLNQETGPPSPAQVFAALGNFFAAISISLLIGLFAHAIALGATSVAVSKFHLGSRITIAEAYRALKDSVGHIIGLYGLYVLILLGTYFAVILGAVVVAGVVAGAVGLMGVKGPLAAIIMGIIMIVAVIGLVVLAVILCMRYTLAVPALVLEKLGPSKALSRSSVLARGRAGQIFLACVLMYLITLVIGTVIESPFWVGGLLMGYKFGHNPVWLQAPATIASGVGGALGYPFLTIALTLFYYDSRVRREGFDLQFMLASMGPAPGAESETPVRDTERLPQTSVLLTVILSFLTAGIYQPLWFLTRLKSFNRLNSREKLAPGIFIAILIAFAAALVIEMLTPWVRARGADVSNLANLASACVIAGGLAQVVQAFKARRILEGHLNARSGELFAQPVALNGVAVFFFNIWYLQYKINELMAIIYPEPSSIGLDSGATIGPATPSAPITS